ncbi:MAG TPA: hypothetical protein VKY89_12355 [Thermoanaerobaculia bacterium]|nr:hypothetical protein [Thermoanaerobaculia bacterium]
MVTLLREILPFLVGLYLADCLTWLGRGQVLIASSFGAEPRLRQGRLALAGLLPLDQAFAISRRGLVATAERLYLPPAGAPPAAAFSEGRWTALPWEEARGLAVDGRELRFSGGRHLRAATAAEARDAAAMVRELLALPPGERETAAGAWSARTLDPEPLLARHTAFQAAVNPLVALGWALLCTLFLALPPLVFLGVPPASLTGTLLLTAAVLWAGTAAAAGGVARRLRRQGLIGGDGALSAICLSLPSAARAAIHLGHDLLHGCDFLAAAAVLLPRGAALPLLRAELHGAAWAAASGGGEGWRRFWEGRRHRLGGILRHLGASEAEALAPPPARSAGAAGYCPHCDAEFPPGPAHCAECDMPLLIYPPP